MRAILTRMFIRPRGLLGRLGGRIMGRNNAAWGIAVSDLLQIVPTDRVLEVGFGSGVVIEHLAKLAGAGLVAGVDPSSEMLAQARSRNKSAIRGGGVDLRCGSVEQLPFDDNSFDKAVAINSMQVWPDAVAGLREIRRVLKPGGLIALGFTPYSGQPKVGVAERLSAAGFAGASLVEGPGRCFCVLATKT
jgi:ubiquinone/menaquinone biosynthesis C-methylase UbiE